MLRILLHSIDIVLLERVGNCLTGYREICFKFGTVRTKSCEGNYVVGIHIITSIILINFHLLPCRVTDEIFTTDIPLGIDGSRGRTGNDVTILTIVSLVNSDSGLCLEFVNSDVTRIADILFSRITSYDGTYCDKKQKYFFHIDCLLKINTKLDMSILMKVCFHPIQDSVSSYLQRV